MHPATVATVQNLAGVYRDTGRYEASERLYLRALEAYEALGEPYYGAAAVVQNNLALLYRKIGAHDVAEGLHKNAIRLSAGVNGRDNPNVAVFSRDLAGLLAEQERSEESEVFFRDAYRIYVDQLRQVPLRGSEDADRIRHDAGGIGSRIRGRSLLRSRSGHSGQAQVARRL